MGKKNIIPFLPSGQYVLHIPVVIEDGEPDSDGQVFVSSEFPLESWWDLEDLVKVIDPNTIKELREERKKDLLAELEELNKLSEENV